MVATFSRIIIYIHTLRAKDDLTRRKFSGDSKLNGLQMPGKKRRDRQGNLPAIATREQSIIKGDLTGRKEQRLPLKRNIQSTEQT